MPSTTWTVPASPESVPHLRESVAVFARERGMPESRVHDVRLAVSEAVTNAVVHAYRERAKPGTVAVSVTVDDGEWIEVRVTDEGGGMTPRDDSPGSGLGLPLIHRLADRVDHRTPPGGSGTELLMRFGFAAI